jgi:8-oxo-dGTP pyrophosphatase MutT (NUDIX family)
MISRDVVTSFLWNNGEVLILRRSARVGTFQGRWAGVSGYIEDPEDEQATREVAEETGLLDADLKLLKKGKLLEVEDPENNVLWRVRPYLFSIEGRGRIKIDWEHTETRWIKPEEISSFETVPGLKEALFSLLEGGLS